LAKNPATLINLIKGDNKSVVTANTKLRHPAGQRIYLADLDLALRAEKGRKSD
jgi:hypothetical protein